MDRYFIRFNPTKEFVQKLYKLQGSNSILQYYGEQGDWHYSSYSDNLKKQEEFLSSDLIQEVTEEEIQQYIKTYTDE
jgi:hypothetical protein